MQLCNNRWLLWDLSAWAGDPPSLSPVHFLALRCARITQDGRRGLARAFAYGQEREQRSEFRLTGLRGGLFTMLAPDSILSNLSEGLGQGKQR